jgi:hypothetical protein
MTVAVVRSWQVKSVNLCSCATTDKLLVHVRPCDKIMMQFYLKHLLEVWLQDGAIPWPRNNCTQRFIVLSDLSLCDFLMFQELQWRQCFTQGELMDEVPRNLSVIPHYTCLLPQFILFHCFYCYLLDNQSWWLLYVSLMLHSSCECSVYIILTSPN